MKTGDDTVDSMFDEEIATTIKPDGSAEIKERGEFQRACDQFVFAQRRFNRIDLHVRTDNATDAGEWFGALKQKFATEEKLWELFCSGFESTQMAKLYLEFRGCLLRGESLKPNA
jgi:hypothetical protein